MASIKPPLPIQEWDFRRIQNLPDQVYFCFTYEYGRNVEPILKAFEDDKKNKLNFDEHGNWHFVVSVYEWQDANPHIERVIDSIDAPPDFPNTPYLQVEHIITSNAYNPFVAPNDEDPPPPPVVSVTWNGQGWFGYRDCRNSSPYEYVYFLAIDWTAPPTKLKEAFVQWMDENKPSYTLAEKQTGKNDNAKRYTFLKNLGVYRLVQHYGTIEAAFKYVANLDENEFGKKVIRGQWLNALYQNIEDWSRARKSAELILNLWKRTSVR